MKEGTSPRVTRLPGFGAKLPRLVMSVTTLPRYGLQPEKISVAEGIADVNSNIRADSFKTATKQWIKHYRKKGLN